MREGKGVKGEGATPPHPKSLAATLALYPTYSLSPQHHDVGTILTPTYKQEKGFFENLMMFPNLLGSGTTRT